MTSAQLLALAATIGSLWAMTWNLMASYRTFRPWSRIYLLIAAFSAFYAAAWAWIVLDPGLDRALWSEVVTPVSIATFFVVWAGPAMISYWRHDPDRGGHEISPGPTVEEIIAMVDESEAEEPWSLR